MRALSQGARPKPTPPGVFKHHLLILRKGLTLQLFKGGGRCWRRLPLHLPLNAVHARDQLCVAPRLARHGLARGALALTYVLEEREQPLCGGRQLPLLSA